MKEENHKMNMSSGCTVSREASTMKGLASGTFARPPPLATRWVDPWAPRKLEFKGWNPDSSQKKKSRKSRRSGRKTVLDDLAKKAQEVKKLRSTRSKTKGDQGPWPRKS